MTSTRDQRRNLYERLVGQTVAGRYEIVRLMGFGGMGAVYEAIQRNMNRRIALKFIPSHNPITAARFEREALTVSQLRHPNTVTVFDYGQTEDGFLYLTMELLNGRTLTELIKEESPIAPERAVHIAAQICRSLSEAHRMGIVHRDIKPDNIFLIEIDGDPDVVKVLDFGIAKVVSGEDDVQLTGDGRIIGTPRYMSPEQILSQTVDHRSDIYSLGCIIFEMLCAAPPFQQSSTTALMISHAQDPPPPFAERLPEDALGRIPLALEHVVRRALVKSPQERQQTTDELREELEAALRSLQGQLSPALARPARLSAPGATHTRDAAPLDEPSKRPPVALALIATALILIAAVLGYLVFTGQGSSHETEAFVAIADPTHTNSDAPSGDDHQMRPAQLQVTIDSEPPGATVLEDGEELGTTPLNLTMPANVEALHYTLALEGYQNRDVTVPLNKNIARRQEFSFFLTPAPKDPVVEEPVKTSSSRTGSKTQRDPERKQQTRRQTERTQDAPTPTSTETAGSTKTDTEPSTPRVPRIERLDDGPRPKVERL